MKEQKKYLKELDCALDKENDGKKSKINNKTL